MKKVWVVAAILAVLSTLACGQGTGNLAYQQQVLNHQTATGYSAAVKNFNQTSHWMFFCNTGLGSGSVQLVGSYDSNAADGVPISNVGYFSGNQCGLVQGGGYYFAVFAQIVSSSGVIAVSAWYSGASGPLPVPQPQITQGSINGGVKPLLQCDSNTTVSVASGTDAQLLAHLPGNGIEVCNMLVTGPAGGTAVSDSLYTASGGGSCVFGSAVNPFTFVLPTTAVQLAYGSNLGWFYGDGAIGVGSGALCYHHPASGEAVQVTISYATY